LLYGLENEETRAAFQRWIAGNWNELLCAGLSDEETGKHLRWHLHAKNMEAVRGNIARYFAKYLGKPLETVSERIPGRWWGKVNGKAVPLSPCSEMPLPERAAIFAHRVARRLLKIRMDQAKHRATAKAAGLTNSKGEPLVSQFGLLGMRDRIRNLDHQKIDWDCFPPGTQRALDWLVLVPGLKGLRWGKATRPKKKRRKGTPPKPDYSKYSRVRLISNHSPATALQIMRFVGTAMKHWVERNPF
jgi:hypothetical protein